MKRDRVIKLMDAVEEKHLMKSGQVWGWEGCGVTGEDRCEICGLTRRWGRLGQNSGDFDQYFDSDGHELTLSQAAKADCE